MFAGVHECECVSACLHEYVVMPTWTQTVEYNMYTCTLCTLLVIVEILYLLTSKGVSCCV